MSSDKAGPAVVQMDPKQPLSVPYPAVDPLRVAGIQNTTPYVVLSPMLVPYVPAPVHYVKAKSKQRTEAVTSPRRARVAVRYVPTVYSCSPQYVPAAYTSPVYCKQAMYVRSVVQQPEVYPVVYATDQNSTRVHGYISALTNTKLTESARPKSKLNPLSEPYKPASKGRVCFCVHREGTNEEVWCCCKSSVDSSRSSTPESWGEEAFIEAISRSASPQTHSADCCHRREKDDGDSDSGVEAESDSESCFACDCGKSLTRVDYNNVEEEGDYPDLRIPRHHDDSALSNDSSHLVDFACTNLRSNEWRAVARELGVDDVIIQSVDYDIYESFKDEMRYVFSYWLRSDESIDNEERHRQMKNALSEVGRFDLIEKLTSLEESDFTEL
uniref:Uncharacterized protein LOC104265727 n=1 Tax=Phallusia mammillata TaxID=59560 RepID=A0A6F9DJM7_9ASCI|nr:uncharacterized protein LOC104265727 [Phallusia mammillata]